MIWVLVILLVIVLFGLHFVDNQDQKDLFSFLVFLLMFLSLLMGAYLAEENGVRSNKPIKPSIVVECKDGKCDTTYIYKGGEQ
jgi:disulfide bond formation protein DsbB